jgi:hypothetical protein
MNDREDVVGDERIMLRVFTEQAGRSVRQLAKAAGMSEARWRQILKGEMSVSGQTVEVVAPADTLARMGYVLQTPPNAFRRAGREDAAKALERIVAAAERGSSAVPLPVTGATGDQADEIDMIYASTTMSAKEKLLRIRQVLQLRAQAEADEAPESSA